MKKLFSFRFLNLYLRGFTIFLKFALSILVIKNLSIEDYGEFGLFQSTVIILTFIVGFDFYTFNSREIFKKGAQPYNYYFTNQLVFHVFAYVLVLPFSIFLFHLGIIDFKYFVLFILITTTEHLSQEFYRLLILLNKTVVATILLFIRSGLWIIILYLIWSQQIVDNNIYTLLLLWFFGAISSVIFGLKFIKFTRLKRIDYNWIWTGLKTALPFFLGTIMYKLIEFSGRYFLNFYSNEEDVGVYTFFTSIANILFVFVQTVVIIEIYPKLLQAKNKNRETFFNVLKIFQKQILQYSIFGLILCLLFIYPLLWFLNKTVLFDSILSYIILVLSTFVFCVSFIYHYALYAFSKDIVILKATVWSFIVNISCGFLLVPRYGVMGASISLFLSFFVILIFKYNYWKKLNV